MPQKIMPPDASRFSLSETTPSNGALMTRLSITCWARCIASCALLRFSCDHRERRLVGRGARLDVLEQLRQPPLRFLERQHVLLRVDRADELVGRRVELGAADVEPRGQQRDFVLRRLHRGVRLHLDDLLLGLGQLRLRLLERVLLIGRIELDHRRRPDLTGIPVGTSLTMRSMPPTGGVTSVMVRPGAQVAGARAPSASAGPSSTRAVGTVSRRAGKRGHRDGSGARRSATMHQRRCSGSTMRRFISSS